jgi:hypothetical protein
LRDGGVGVVGAAPSAAVSLAKVAQSARRG